MVNGYCIADYKSGTRVGREEGGPMYAYVVVLKNSAWVTEHGEYVSSILEQHLGNTHHLRPEQLVILRLVRHFLADQFGIFFRGF